MQDGWKRMGGGWEMWLNLSRVLKDLITVRDEHHIYFLAGRQTKGNINKSWEIVQL